MRGEGGGRPGGTADLRPPPRAVTFNGNLTRKEVTQLKIYFLWSNIDILKTTISGARSGERGKT